MKKIIFSGMLILICCLFGGVGAVEAGVDISGQCYNVPEVLAGIRLGDFACQIAGYGSCIETDGDFVFFTGTDCSNNFMSQPMSVNKCDTVSWNWGPAFKSIRADHLICDVRSWGMIPQPDNVPGDFEQSIKNTTDWILGFVGMIAVLMIVWGGINYLTSAGDEDKAKTGKRTVQYAIVGLVVAGIAYAVVDVIVTVIL